MKRPIVSDKPAAIAAPSSPKSHERKLAEATEYIVDQITKQFRNQALLALNVSTVDKFADAQTGNYASVFLKLANSVKRRLLKRFTNDRLTRLVKTIMQQVDKDARQKLYAQVEKHVGINVTQLVANEGLKSQTNALMLETVQWVKKIRDETLEEYTNNTLHAMTEGKSLDQILEQYDGLAEKRKNHAVFTARNQIQNYNAITTKLRVQNLGITRAVWKTAHDERVRSSHADRDGKEFDLSEGLYSSVDGKTLLPGIDFNCRCTATYIIPES
ncbi:phage minor head protein [Pantoea brenneri]|uniref:phage minor head protein n=1 Tax=Pantoea brenneri TaxID=472694 RepID=UPI0024482206|nr:phage minor head protein [Pantoea brenneri]MDH1085309.1 phage minor head protein [Pantoea brenneri]